MVYYFKSACRTVEGNRGRYRLKYHDGGGELKEFKSILVMNLFILFDLYLRFGDINTRLRQRRKVVEK